MIEILMIIYIVSVIGSTWMVYRSARTQYEYIEYTTLIAMICVIVCPILNTITFINHSISLIGGRKFKNPIYKDKTND